LLGLIFFGRRLVGLGLNLKSIAGLWLALVTVRYASFPVDYVSVPS
jgi:hypothetical protein